MSIWFAAWTIPTICGSLGAWAYALRPPAPSSTADVNTAAKQVFFMFNLFSPFLIEFFRYSLWVCVLPAQGPQTIESRPVERLQRVSNFALLRLGSATCAAAASS